MLEQIELVAVSEASLDVMSEKGLQIIIFGIIMSISIAL